MPRDGPGPSPQNLLQEKALWAKVDHRKGMSGKIVNDACSGQHGVGKDRSEA